MSLASTRRLGLDDPRLQQFWSERHLQTLTTLRDDGRPHTVPVAAVLDAQEGIARILASSSSAKVRHIRRGAPASVTLCQVDGRRWTTLEGRAHVVDDAAAIAEAERRYAQRYRVPRSNPDRIVIQVQVTAVLGALDDPRGMATPAG